MRRTALLLAAAAIAIAVVLCLVPHFRGESPREDVRDAPAEGGADAGSDETAHAKRRSDAATRRGPVLVGDVTDGDAPAANAAVECVRLGDEPPPRSERPAAWLEVFSSAARSPAPAWRGTSDAAGRFRSGPLAPGRWRVVARTADGRAASESVSVETRADATVRLRLPPPGHAIRGRVEGADGAPVAARVAVQAVTDRGFAPDEFTRLAWGDTAPDGTFVVAGIAAARVNVVAAAGTEVVSVGPVTLPREEPLVVRFGEGVTRRRGLVRDAATKSPVAGARISWIAWTANKERTVGTQAVSGADGRFELPGLAHGRAFVEADGFATEHVWDHGGAGEIVVELARLAAIGGRVVAASDGRSVEGAVVHATGRRNLDPVVRATSEAEGAFRLDGAVPGDAFVFVHGGGWTSIGLGSARDDGPNAFFVRAGARDALVLRVEPSARATGRVLDAEGAPVPGAKVSTWSRAFGHTRDAAPFPEAVCDAAGRFELTDLIAGAQYQVRVSADGWAEAYAEHVAGTPGDLELRLLDSWFVDVRVVAEEDGHPIEGAKVRGEVREFFEVRRFGDAATTDADGRARVGPGPRGEFGLRVDAPDRLRREEPWWVGAVERDGRAFAEVRVPKGLAIAGRVEIPEGAPRNRIHINATEVATDMGIAEFWTDTPEFRVERLAPGPHVVGATLDAGDGREWSGHVRADAGASDVVIALTAEPPEPVTNEHELFVRVLGSDGAPVFAADVWGRFRRRSNLSTAGGRFEDGVATLRVPHDAEKVEVEVRRARDRQERPLPCGGARVEMPDPRATEFVVRLPRARAIEGRVVGADGVAVAGARVGAGFSVPLESPQGFPQDAALTWSGADGKFRLDGLGEGRFWVGAQVPGGWRAATPVEVESGATDVAIVVEPVRPLRIVVLDADGAPLVGASVLVSLDNAQQLGRTGSDGGFALPDVLPGAGGWLDVAPPDSRLDLLPLTLPKWTPEDATFRLDAAALVSGTIRDARGRPLGGLSVHCTGEGVRPARPARTDEAGRFVVGRLPSGTTVRVLAALPEEDAVDVGEAVAGAADLSFVLDVGNCVRVRVANARRSEIEGPVRALLADGSERYGRFGPDGTALVPNLPEGAVLRLRLGPTCEHRWAAADGVVTGDRDVELTLREGGTIAGRVERPAGFVGEVNGTAERDGFRVELEPSRFLARGLAPGVWRLRFEGTARTGERWEGTAEAEAGDLDVVVRLVRKP